MALLRIKYWSSLFIITEKNDAYTMVLCCVVCKYRFVKDDGVKSHRFPPDERERKIWLRACHLTHVSDYDRICGKHFRQHEYKSAGSNRLKEGVVPRFSCNGSDDSESRKRAPPKDRSFNTSSSSLSDDSVLSDDSFSPVTKKVRKLPASPTKDALKQKNMELKKKIKTLNQRLRRKEHKIQTLSGMYKELSERKLLSDNFAEELKEKFPGMSAEIMLNHFNNCSKKPQGYRHSDEAKKFALTLNFYSARAYDFVRKVFTLPDPRSLCVWTSSVQCEPGFFDDVFEHLGKSIEKDPLNADTTLFVDAMGIQQCQGWNKYQDKINGFTNCGEGVVLDDPDEVASDALVFLLVGMRQHWKYPTGFALCNKIKAEHLYCLISKCLNMSIKKVY